ncbi:serine hydrolase domain-containing protein [uncultured Pontibacter sp.]|uniref:serine hydrolase domain-containing protein n=1 Tax=uncultured Pontibacter sp. TaxID=453356 RepID=UPI0026068B90|nr:serine hydrolase domain-containing protein [uncultured Pontibacter sp.]
MGNKKPKKMKLIILLILGITISSCNKHSNDITNSKTDPVKISIEKNADSLLLDPKINSVSIGIYKDGKIYTGHFGELDKGIGNTPTDATLYEIASVSKSFTGTLVAQAILDKKINLNDDIRKYLDGDFSNLEYNNSPIKIKHLITHTSGLPRSLPTSIDALFDNIDENLPFKIYEIEKNYSKTQFLGDLQTVKIATIPGTSFNYSNADTEVMAHILEKVYKMTYDQLLQKFICKPAGMKDTKVKLSAEESKRLANGYGETNKLVPHFANTLWGADGGIKSTTSDLVNYMKFQLDSTNLAAAESHQLLFAENDIQIGYLWPIINNAEDGVYYNIHGGAFGTQNYFLIIPKYNLGVSIITNQSGPETQDKLWNTMKNLLTDIKKL